MRFELQTPVPVAEVDAFGELRPASYVRLLQLAAAKASEAAGYDHAWYERNGTTWVVRHTRLEIDGTLGHGDDLVVRTWVADFRRVRSLRRYEVYRASDRAPVARAATDWIYVAGATAAPVSAPRELQHAFLSGAGEPSVPRSRIRFPQQTAEPRQVALRRVELADLDSLGHVNNSRYADFVQQALYEVLERHGWRPESPPSGGHLRPTAIELEYLKPAFYRQSLAVRIAGPTLRDAEISGAFEILANQTIAVRALASWQWTTPPLPSSLEGSLAASSAASETTGTSP